MRDVIEREWKTKETKSDLTVRKTQDGLLERRRAAEKSATEMFRIPLVLRVLLSLVTFGGLICLLIYFEIGSDMTFAETVENNSYLFLVVGAPLTVIGVAAVFLNVLRVKRITASPAFAYAEEQRDKISRECLESLGVPESATPIDVFVTITKNGKKKALMARENLDCRVYREDDALMLSDREILVRIPLSEITYFGQTKKWISFYGWNKEKLTRNRYRGYKIGRNNQSGTYSVKGCCVLRILHGGMEYELTVPPYEAETLVRLTGRTAQ